MSGIGRWVRGVATGTAAMLAAAPAGLAADTSWEVALRLRQEALATLSADAARDDTYGFGGARLRLSGGAAWERVSLHGTVQAAGAWSLPRDGSFGLGRIYFDAAGGDDTSPGHLDVAELHAVFRTSERSRVTVGRHAIREGQERISKDARIAWLQRARASERLVGAWDWVHVGRRFDGLSVDVDAGPYGWNGFAARVLAGGVDYDDAFDPLDDVEVLGASLAVPENTWLRDTAVRLFAIRYADDRAVTRAGLGDEVTIVAFGASAAAAIRGDRGVTDVMAWGAVQAGDFGLADHSAWAVVLEGGHQFTAARLSPWVRAGIAHASGDDRPGDGDHDTFFNMAPTNHKFYGSADLNAFQNLTDLYAELRLAVAEDVRLAVEGHVFRRAESADAWYGGSGPANEGAFGYAARVPAGGPAASSRDIGSEIDASVTWSVRPGLAVSGGASVFDGGRVARAVFPVESDVTWAWLQVTWRTGS